MFAKLPGVKIECGRLRELLHSVPRLAGPANALESDAEARDMKGAPLLAQHINAMDAQGADGVAGDD